MDGRRKVLVVAESATKSTLQFLENILIQHPTAEVIIVSSNGWEFEQLRWQVQRDRRRPVHVYECNFHRLEIRALVNRLTIYHGHVDVLYCHDADEGSQYANGVHELKEQLQRAFPAMQYDVSV